MRLKVSRSKNAALCQDPVPFFKYDCTNFFYEIEQEENMKQYGPSKEHRPNRLRNGQKLIVTFSLKYKHYQQGIRDRQVKRAEKMLEQCIIDEEARHDGFYAVCTNLADEPPKIAKINHSRWEIEECFRIMKTDFKSRPAYARRQPYPDSLHEAFGFRTDYEIVSQKQMKKIFRDTKKEKSA